MTSSPAEGGIRRSLGSRRSEIEVLRFRFRAELRTRWGSWTGLAALIGITFGIALVFSTGARRSRHAYKEFLANQHAADVVLQVGCSSSAEISRGEACLDELRKLPAVRDVAGVLELPASVTTDGRSIGPEPEDPCYTGPGQVIVIGDPTGQYGTDLNVGRLVAGRRFVPSESASKGPSPSPV